MKKFSGTIIGYFRKAGLEIDDKALEIAEMAEKDKQKSDYDIKTTVIKWVKLIGIPAFLGGSGTLLYKYTDIILAKLF